MVTEVLLGSGAAYLLLRRWGDPARAWPGALWSYLPWYGAHLSWIAYVGYLALGLEVFLLAVAMRTWGRISWRRALLIAGIVRGMGLIVRFAAVRFA